MPFPVMLSVSGLFLRYSEDVQIYIFKLCKISKILHYIYKYLLKSVKYYTTAEKALCKGVEELFAGKTIKTAYTGNHGLP